MSEQLKLNQQGAITGYQLHEAVSGYDFEQQASGLLVAESVRHDHNAHPNPMNVATAASESHQKTHGLVTIEHQVGNKTILLAQPYLSNEATLLLPTPAPAPKPAPEPAPAPSPKPAEAPKPAPAPVCATPAVPKTTINPDNSAEKVKNIVKLDVGQAEKVVEGNNVLLRDENLQLFGAFNGLEDKAQASSQAAAKAIHAAYLKNRGNRSIQYTSTDQAKDAMEAAFNEATDAIVALDGRTSGTVGAIEVINGKTQFIIGDTGYSRAYLSKPDGSIIEIGGSGSPSKVDGSLRFSVVQIETGDRIMICTGKTASRKSDMTEAFKHSNPDESAKEFIERTQNDHEQSVMVIDIEDAPGTIAKQPPAPVPAPKPRLRTPADDPVTTQLKPAPRPRSATDPRTLPHQTVTPVTDPRATKNKLSKSRLGGKWSKRLAFYATKSATELAMMPYKMIRSKEKGGYTSLKKAAILMIGSAGALAVLQALEPDHVNSSGVTETVTTPSTSAASIGEGTSPMTEKMTPQQIARALAEQEASR